MPTKVRIPSPLRSFTDGADAIQAQGDTVAGALNDVMQQAPGIGPRLYKTLPAEGTPGTLNRFVNLYVNDEDIRFLDGLDTKLTEGDELSIIPAIAGG
jgi:molybdopterin converting factor small subunit